MTYPDYGIELLSTRFLVARCEAAKLQADNANTKAARRHWLALVRACERELNSR